MKLKFTIIFLFYINGLIFGQQATQYSLYQMNPYAFNPAYAGMDESLSFTGVYRNQWLGLEGSPESQNISIHTPFYFIGGGVGLNVNNDFIGAHRRTTASLSYSKYLSVGNQGQLGIGLAGGMIQQAYNGGDLRTPQGSYEGTITHNDDFLPNNNVSAITPTISVGIYLKKERLQVGLSANNLVESTLDYSLENTNSNIRTKRHYYIYGAYEVDLGDYLTITPSVFAKTDLVETQTDLSAIFTLNEIIFAGASFRGFNPTSLDALVLMAGMQVNANVKFGYAFDMTLSRLQTVQSGTHEIVLTYNLNKKIGAGLPPPIIYNPRSL